MSQDSPLSISASVIGILTLAVSVVVFLVQNFERAKKMDSEIYDTGVAVLQSAEDTNEIAHLVGAAAGSQEEVLIDMCTQLDLQNGDVLLQMIQKSALQRIFSGAMWEVDQKKVRKNIKRVKGLRSRIFFVKVYNISTRINDASSNLGLKIDHMHEDLRLVISQVQDKLIHELALQQPKVQPLKEPQEGHEAGIGEDPEENPQPPHHHPQEHAQDNPQYFPQNPPPPQDYPRSPSLGNSQDNLPRKSASYYPPPQLSSYNLQNPVIAHPDPVQGVMHLVGQRQANLSNLDGMRATLEVELRQFLEREMIRPSLFPNLLMLIAFFLLAQHSL